MKRQLNILIICLAFPFAGTAQNGLPFEMKEIHVNVPVDLPNLQKDSLARKGDYLEYNVTGQIINDTNTYEIHPIISADKSTPWMILGELLQAYSSGNLNDIKALYTKASVNRINQVLTSGEATDRYLSLVKEIKTMHPYFAMEYDNGVIALVETNPGNIERFRFVKEKNNYMLEAYEEKNIPQVNNVMVYYQFRPLPPLKPQMIQSPDSLKSDESPFITFKLNKSGDWLSVFLPVAGYSVELQEQDGGLNDYDKTPGIVKIIFYGSSFPVGSLDLMAVESNYPPNLISGNMISEGEKFHVKIKE